MYIIGKPNKGLELSNKRISGMFNAKSISIERIINFCSCLFFIQMKNTIALNEFKAIVC